MTLVFGSHLVQCAHVPLSTYVVQNAEAQLRDAKERLFEQERRLAEQTKLIAELTLKVHTEHRHTHTHTHTNTHTHTHVLTFHALNCTYCAATGRAAKQCSGGH